MTSSCIKSKKSFSASNTLIFTKDACLLGSGDKVTKNLTEGLERREWFIRSGLTLLPFRVKKGKRNKLISNLSCQMLSVVPKASARSNPPFARQKPSQGTETSPFLDECLLNMQYAPDMVLNSVDLCSSSGEPLPSFLGNTNENLHHRDYWPFIKHRNVMTFLFFRSFSLLPAF